MSEASQDHWALPGSVEVGSDGHLHLVGGVCVACSDTVFPRPRICSKCWSEDIAAKHLARRGKLYSYSVVHAARKGWRAPYAIAYVDLDDGVRVCGPLEGALDRLPALDSIVELMVGPLRTDADGREVLSHRFAAATGDK